MGAVIKIDAAIQPFLLATSVTKKIDHYTILGDEMNETISIWGTCTSRDIFGIGLRDGENLSEGGYRIERYVQGNHPFSAISKSVALKEAGENSLVLNEVCAGNAEFHKRMLNFAVNKGVFDYFASVHSDYFMLDAGPFRYDLLKYNVHSENSQGYPLGSSYIENRYKPPLRKLKEYGVIPKEDEVIYPQDLPEDKVEAFMEIFSEKIHQIYDEEEIILNEIIPCFLYINNRTFQCFDTRNIPNYYRDTDRDTINYYFIWYKKIFPRAHVIEFPDFVPGDGAHKWGRNPFHYVQEYYDYALAAVDVIVQEKLPPDEEKRKLQDLKNRCQDKIWEKYESMLVSTIKEFSIALTIKDFWGKKSLCTYYDTARIDLKDAGSGDNHLKILEISDPNARVQNPAWFNKNGVGTEITFKKRKFNIRFLCCGNGTLQVALRGMDVRDEKKNRIRVWILYKDFAVNEETIFSEPKAVWHDQPFKYERKVNDGEEISISVAFEPIYNGEEFKT